jgi:hypothetical protein
LTDFGKRKEEETMGSTRRKYDWEGASFHDHDLGGGVNGDVFGDVTQSVYNRGKAVQYAETWWNSHNPAYPFFSKDDCTNFISQCLHEGGIPMGKGWWCRRGRWSYSWAVAHGLYLFLKKGGSTGKVIQVDGPGQLDYGDVICYDWEGDGRWNHNVIVTAFDESRTPLVNAHTYNSRQRRWEYTDSPAYTPRTRYAFFHIS